MSEQIGSAISVDHLVRGFGSGADRLTAVDDVSLTVAAGSVVALTGPSGSGKSTLLHLIGAIEQPDEGTVAVDGVVVNDLRRPRWPRYRQRVGFVFQRYHLLPALTVLDNVIAPVLPHRGRADHAARGPRAARRGRPGRAGAGPAGAALRWPAATGRHRPRTDGRAGPAAGRRAHRQPRLHHRRADPRPAARPPRPARHDHPARHPRTGHRRPLRPVGPPDRRTVTEDLDLTDGEDPAETYERAARLRL